MSDLVVNPEDRFSRVAAHLVLAICSFQNLNVSVSESLAFTGTLMVLNEIMGDNRLVELILSCIIILAGNYINEFVTGLES